MNKIKYLNISIIILLFIITMCFLKFPFIANDDMYMFFPYNFDFCHFRVINELIMALFHVWLPIFLNINPQDFAIISQSLLRAILYIAMICYMSKSYNCYKEKPILYTVMLCVTFYTLYAMMLQDDFTFSFDINEFFMGYVSPNIIIFLAFWYRLKTFYFEEESMCRRNIIIIFILFVLTLMTNEEQYIASIFLLIFILTEFLYKYRKEKNNITKNKIFYLLSLIIFFSVAVFYMLIIHPAVKNLWNEYELYINLHITFDTLKKFIYSYAKNIIWNNIYIIIPIIINIILLHINKIKYQKELRYIIYTLIGFTVFQIATITLPLNCYCTYGNIKFWYLHKGLLFTYRAFLYFILMYITGYTYHFLNNKIKVKNIPIIIFLVSVILYNTSIEFRYTTCFWKEARKNLYIAEKLSLYYIKQNKTAILPNNLIPIEIVQGVYPWDMRDKPEIYTKTYTDTPYHRYLKLVYGVETTKGMTFLPNEEAIRIYKENGGKLTDEELEKLDFRNIEKQFD